MARSNVAIARGQPAHARKLRFDLVIPTLGRPSLLSLFKDLAGADGPRPERILLVDDRPLHAREESLFRGPIPFELEDLLRVLPGRAEGPAAARNMGWRAGSAPWVVFLDDDVRLEREWAQHLESDLLSQPADVGGVRGRVRVPLPRYRAPTEHERLAATREHAQFLASDIAYRRAALELVGGFDERFDRPSREDADLGLRVVDNGYQVVRGERLIEHPVEEEDSWHSLSRQRQYADDVIMRSLHGPRWRERTGAPPGDRTRHLVTTLAGAGAVLGLAAGAMPLALGCGAVWTAATASLAWHRIAPGPRTVDEVITASATSTVVPVASTWHWLRGVTRAVLKNPEPHRPLPRLPEPRVRAVIVERDGVLIEDEPYLGDPLAVRPRPLAREGLDKLRAAGVPIIVIADQGPPERPPLDEDSVDELNARVEALLGPFDGWFLCTHRPGEGCVCRRPGATMVLEAAEHANALPHECVVIGDERQDLDAARAAGARSVLVPTQLTRCEDVWNADEVAADLAAAADRVLLRARVVLTEVPR